MTVCPYGAMFNLEMKIFFEGKNFILYYSLRKKKDWNATGSMILTSESVSITVDEKTPVGCSGNEWYPCSPAVLVNFL